MLIVPPVKAHVDVVVHHHTEEAFHLEETENHNHFQHHHHNDEDDQSTDHYHCSMISYANAIVTPQLTCDFITIPEVRTTIIAYKNLYNSNYLDNLFQPPRA